VEIMNERIMTKVRITSDERTKSRSEGLRTIVDRLRQSITKTIGAGWNSVQSLDDARQEK